MKDKQIKTLRNKVKNGGSVAPMLIVLGILVCSVAYFGGWFESGQDVPDSAYKVTYADDSNNFFWRMGDPECIEENGETLCYYYPNNIVFGVRTGNVESSVKIDCGDGGFVEGHTGPTPSDGSSGNTAFLHHTYTSAGTYTAKLSLDGVYSTSVDVVIVTLTPSIDNLTAKYAHTYTPPVQLTWYEQMWYEFKDWWAHLFNPKTYDGVTTIVSSQDVVAIDSPFTYTAENYSTEPCTLTFDASNARNYFGTHNSDGTVKDDWTYHQNDYPLDKYNFNYSWDFGDGSTGTGTKVTHTYTCDCQKTVTLSAIVTSINCVDKDGNPIVCPPSAFYVTYSKEINTCAHPVVIPVDPADCVTVYEYRESRPVDGCTVKTLCGPQPASWEVGLHRFDTMAECTSYKNSFGLVDVIDDIVDDDDDKDNDDPIEPVPLTFFSKVYSAIAGFFKWLFR
jgi:hypothetical protein